MMTKNSFLADYPFNPEDISCGVLEYDSLFQTCGMIIKIYNYGKMFVRMLSGPQYQLTKDIPCEVCMMPTSFMNKAHL